MHLLSLRLQIPIMGLIITLLVMATVAVKSLGVVKGNIPRSTSQRSLLSPMSTPGTDLCVLSLAPVTKPGPDHFEKLIKAQT